ncbi:hypothetical protein D9M70_522230 [compost metagenome]
MLDQQDGGAGVAADALQQFIEGMRFARIEASRRLIEAQQLRSRAHGTSNLQPPLRAVRQVPGRVVCPVDQRCLFEPMLGEFSRLPGGLPVGRKSKEPEHGIARRQH